MGGGELQAQLASKEGQLGASGLTEANESERSQSEKGKMRVIGFVMGEAPKSMSFLSLHFKSESTNRPRR